MRGVEAGAGEEAEGGLQAFDGFVRDVAAFETNAVGTEDCDFAIGYGCREGHNILRDYAIATDEGMTADAAELVDAAERADGRPILNFDVPGEGDGVGEDDVATNDAIMRDVHVGHEPVAIADLGECAAAFGAAVDGDEFADGVAVADAGDGGFALVLLVLGGDAYGAEGIKNVVGTDDGVPIDVVVRHEASAGADFDIGTDDAVRADLGGRVNQGTVVQGLGSLRSSLHITSASATRTPLTVARPAILATVPLRLRTVSSMRS